MNFQYKVRNSNGKIVSATADAPTRCSLIKDLNTKGIYPIAVIPAETQTNVSGVFPEKKPPQAAKKISWLFRPIGAAIKEQEVLILTRDLLSLVHAGIPLVSGIGDIAEQVKNRRLREILQEIAADVNGGSKLSQAFEKHPKVFFEFYCNSVAAGEEAGRLEEILDRLADTMENEIETSLTIKNAVRYPAIVLGFLGLAFILIVTIVVPRISKVFMQFNTALPLPTRILITVGDFAQRHGIGILAGLAVLAILLGIYKKTKQGKLVWDFAKLKLPVFGDLFQKAALSKFASTLRTLYASGVLLPDALETSARVTGNEIIARGVLRACQGVNEGRAISETLRENNFFPPLVIRMIMMGEKAGNLEKMLGEIVQHYDRDIRYMTKTLTTLIEPILTVCLGLMILVLALGVFLPMWNVMSLFRH